MEVIQYEGVNAIVQFEGVNEPHFTSTIEDGIYKYYDITGNLHRIDGPAMHTDDQSIMFVICGRFYPFDAWCMLLDISKEEKARISLEYVL